MNGVLRLRRGRRGEFRGTRVSVVISQDVAGSLTLEIRDGVDCSRIVRVADSSETRPKQMSNMRTLPRDGRPTAAKTRASRPTSTPERAARTAARRASHVTTGQREHRYLDGVVPFHDEYESRVKLHVRPTFDRTPAGLPGPRATAADDAKASFRPAVTAVVRRAVTPARSVATRTSAMGCRPWTSRRSPRYGPVQALRRARRPR
jgi:hypothetical protein